jgi:hypothetical protein
MKPVPLQDTGLIAVCAIASCLGLNDVIKQWLLNHTARTEAATPMGTSVSM